MEACREQSLTNAVVKVLDPNRSGGDGRSTRLDPSRTNLSDPPLLPKLTNGTKGSPVSGVCKT